MMKYKLDNGEILECDAIGIVGIDEIPVDSLKLVPQIYTSRFIKAATWALANDYQRLRYVSYEINGRMFAKFVPTTEGSMRRTQWERLHYYHGKI